MKNKIIVLDFDHTVFNTTAYVDQLQKDLEKIGVSKKVFWKSREYLKDCCHLVDIDKFLESLAVDNFEEVHNVIHSSIKKNASEFIFSDVKDFIEQHKSDFDFLILTQGDEELQTEKIEHSKIFIDFKIVSESKVEVFKDLVKKYERVIFIDDKVKNIDDVKKVFSEVETYFMKRLGDSPYGGVESECGCVDFVVESLWIKGDLKKEDYFEKVNIIFTMLTLHWRNYEILFGTSKKRIELLSKSDGGFFKIVEVILFEKIQLEICKLVLDPEKSLNGNREVIDKSYTLEGLIKFIKNKYNNEKIILELYKIYSQLKKKCEKADLKDIRNKKIAHNSMNLSNKDIENKLSRKNIRHILEMIIEFMNKINIHYNDSKTLYFSDKNNLHKLSIVHKLVEAERYEELIKKSKGKISWREDILKTKYYSALDD